MSARTLLAFCCTLASAASAASAIAAANETPQQLATRHLCFGCHAVAEFRAGPSFMDVAERYGQRQEVVDALLKKLKSGSVGQWGSTPMPPESVPDGELQNILHWVLEQ